MFIAVYIVCKLIQPTGCHTDKITSHRGERGNGALVVVSAADVLDNGHLFDVGDVRIQLVLMKVVTIASVDNGRDAVDSLIANSTVSRTCVLTALV